jgi:hypothetical protein
VTTIAKRQKQLAALIRKLDRTITDPGQRAVPVHKRGAQVEAPRAGEPFEHSSTMLGRCFCNQDRNLRCVIESFLCWNTRGDEVLGIMHKFDQTLVDANELRVMMPGEVAELLGSECDDGFAVERIERLLGTLGEIYKRDHKVSLVQFVGKPEKTLLSYLGSLAMMPRYVIDRVSMMEHGGPHVPIDDLSLRLLIDAQVMEPEATAEEATNFVSKHVKQTELLMAFQLLEAAPINEDWRLPSEPIQPTAGDEDAEAMVAMEAANQKPSAKLPAAKPGGVKAKSATRVSSEKATKLGAKAIKPGTKVRAKPANKTAGKAMSGTGKPKKPSKT